MLVVCKITNDIMHIVYGAKHIEEAIATLVTDQPDQVEKQMSLIKSFFMQTFRNHIEIIFSICCRCLMA